MGKVKAKRMGEVKAKRMGEVKAKRMGEVKAKRMVKVTWPRGLHRCGATAVAETTGSQEASRRIKGL